MTPEDLFDAMSKAWKIGGDGNDDDLDNSVNETALTSTSHTKCYNCKQLGHKANKCPKQKTGGTGKFMGNCNLCRRQGHKKSDYWELEVNPSKRLSGWVFSMSNKGTNGANIEVLVANIENKKIV